MKRLLVPALLILSAPVVAQEDMVIDQTRLYASDPAACTAMEAGETLEVLEHLVLSFQDGIQSMEFHCGFHDVKSRPNTPVLFVDAVCELPGELYPDILAIAPYDEKTIQVVSSGDTILAMLGTLAGEQSADKVTPPGTVLYTRCDNLSEIPVD